MRRYQQLEELPEAEPQPQPQVQPQPQLQPLAPVPQQQPLPLGLPSTPAGAADPAAGFMPRSGQATPRPGQVTPALDPEEDDEVAATTAQSQTERVMATLFGVGNRMWHHVLRELGWAVASAAIAILGAIVSSATDASFLGAKLGSWLHFVSYSVVISIPGRLMDALFFGAVGALGGFVTNARLNPIFFYLAAFEGAIYRFWWLGMSLSSFDTILRIQRSTVIEGILEALLAYQVLAVVRNLGLRLGLRNLLIGSYELALHNVLFSHSVLLSVTKRCAVTSNGVVLDQGLPYKEVLKMWLAPDFRRKLDFAAKLRFRMYDRENQLVAVAKKEAIVPFAKLAFKRLAALPEELLPAVDVQNREAILDPAQWLHGPQNGGAGVGGAGAGAGAKAATGVGPAGTGAAGMTSIAAAASSASFGPSTVAATQAGAPTAADRASLGPSSAPAASAAAATAAAGAALQATTAAAGQEARNRSGKIAVAASTMVTAQAAAAAPADSAGSATSGHLSQDGTGTGAGAAGVTGNSTAPAAEQQQHHASQLMHANSNSGSNRPIGMVNSASTGALASESLDLALFDDGLGDDDEDSGRPGGAGGAARGGASAAAAAAGVTAFVGRARSGTQALLQNRLAGLTTAASALAARASKVLGQGHKDGSGLQHGSAAAGAATATAGASQGTGGGEDLGLSLDDAGPVDSGAVSISIAAHAPASDHARSVSAASGPPEQQLPGQAQAAGGDEHGIRRGTSQLARDAAGAAIRRTVSPSLAMPQLAREAANAAAHMSPSRGTVASAAPWLGGGGAGLRAAGTSSAAAAAAAAAAPGMGTLSPLSAGLPPAPSAPPVLAASSSSGGSLTGLPQRSRALTQMTFVRPGVAAAASPAGAVDAAGGLSTSLSQHATPGTAAAAPAAAPAAAEETAASNTDAAPSHPHTRGRTATRAELTHAATLAGDGAVWPASTADAEAAGANADGAGGVGGAGAGGALFCPPRSNSLPSARRQASHFFDASDVQAVLDAFARLPAHHAGGTSHGGSAAGADSSYASGGTEGGDASAGGQTAGAGTTPAGAGQASAAGSVIFGHYASPGMLLSSAPSTAVSRQASFRSWGSNGGPGATTVDGGRSRAPSMALAASVAAAYGAYGQHPHSHLGYSTPAGQLHLAGGGGQGPSSHAGATRGHRLSSFDVSAAALAAASGEPPAALGLSAGAHSASASAAAPAASHVPVPGAMARMAQARRGSDPNISITAASPPAALPATQSDLGARGAAAATSLAGGATAASSAGGAAGSASASSIIARSNSFSSGTSGAGSGGMGCGSGGAAGGAAGPGGSLSSVTGLTLRERVFNVLRFNTATTGADDGQASVGRAGNAGAAAWRRGSRRDSGTAGGDGRTAAAGAGSSTSGGGGSGGLASFFSSNHYHTIQGLSAAALHAIKIGIQHITLDQELEAEAEAEAEAGRAAAGAGFGGTSSNGGGGGGGGVAAGAGPGALGGSGRGAGFAAAGSGGAAAGGDGGAGAFAAGGPAAPGMDGGAGGGALIPAGADGAASPVPALAPPPPKVYPKLRIAHFAAVLDREVLDLEKAFALFDSNGDGLVEREEFITAIMTMYDETRALRASLNGHQTVSSALSFLADFLLWLTLGGFAIWKFEVPSVVVTTIGTVLVSASFAISSSVSTVVLSLLFVLLVQPYHIGDRVTASGVFNGEQTLIVKRIDVLTTTFHLINNKQITVPNSQLFGMVIENHKRSPAALIRIDLRVSVHTTAAQLEALRQRMNSFLDTQPLHWKPNCIIRATMIAEQSIVLALFGQSTYKWQDAPNLFRNVFALHVALLAALREVGIALGGTKLEGTLNLAASAAGLTVGAGGTLTAAAAAAAPATSTASAAASGGAGAAALPALAAPVQAVPAAAAAPLPTAAAIAANAPAAAASTAVSSDSAATTTALLQALLLQQQQQQALQMQLLQLLVQQALSGGGGGGAATSALAAAAAAAAAATAGAGAGAGAMPASLASMPTAGAGGNVA